MQLARFALLSLCTAIVAGCGTVMTRNGSATFGAYPYQSIAADGQLFDEAALGHHRFSTSDCCLGVTMALVSVPIDFCVDTVMLPVDLGYWIGGKRKTTDKYWEVHFPAGD